MELAAEEGHGSEGHGSQTRVILAPCVYKGCKWSLIPGAVDVHAHVHVDIRALEAKASSRPTWQSVLCQMATLGTPRWGYIYVLNLKLQKVYSSVPMQATTGLSEHRERQGPSASTRTGAPCSRPQAAWQA